MPQLPGMTVYWQRGGGAQRSGETGGTKRSEKGRRAIFAVFPSKSPRVNRNMYVG